MESIFIMDSIDMKNYGVDGFPFMMLKFYLINQINQLRIRWTATYFLISLDNLWCVDKNEYVIMLLPYCKFLEN